MEEDVFQVRLKMVYEIILKDGSRKYADTEQELLKEIAVLLKNQTPVVEESSAITQSNFMNQSSKYPKKDNQIQNVPPLCD